MLVRAAASDQAEQDRFLRIRKPRRVSIRDLALPAVVQTGSERACRPGGIRMFGSDTSGSDPRQRGVIERDFRKRHEQKPDSAAM